MPKLWLYRYPCGKIGYFIGIHKVATKVTGKLDKRHKYVMWNCHRYQIGGWING
jgi:hypothetical protein